MYSMKTVIKKYICVVCLTLPIISNAAQGLCGAGLVKELVEGYQGTDQVMIYLQATEGDSSMVLKMSSRVPGNWPTKSIALSKTLRAAMSAHLPVRIYSEISPSNIINRCSFINEVRICYDVNDCE